MSAHKFEITGDSPVIPDILFWRLIGHEALSSPAVYELIVLSKKKKLDAKDVLGKGFDVIITFDDEGKSPYKRHCQGYATRLTRLAQVGRHYEYRITLRSWFWLLTRRTNSRIFQDLNLPDILDKVFDDAPISPYKKINKRLTASYEPKRYCVQYQESDFQFLSRLMEQEGVYYWFDAHDEPGTMYFSDNSDVAHSVLPAKATLNYILGDIGDARFNEVVRWTSSRRLDTGKYDSRDSDFKAIRKKLGTSMNVADDHDLADFEEFEFAGGYFKSSDADRLARIHGDELIARRDRHWAVTSWPDVAVGKRFTLSGDTDGTANGDYLIGACTFVVTHSGYEGIHIEEPSEPIADVVDGMLAGDAVNGNSREMVLDIIHSTPALLRGARGVSAFLLTALPVELPFRPARVTPRVTMPGPQSGIVVGPKGQEIHADDFGRVKVQFHWDREGQSDEKSTCFIRVSQPWAGKGWGGYFTPRIGQEVIVDFLNGDPDRPIIVGRVYNDDQPIPYQSPTQSGFKTRSTPGGNPNNYNEIRFEDKKGSEEVNIHAERNMSTSVEVDDSTTVGHDQTLTVDNDRTARVRGNEKWSVEKDQTTEVVKNQTNRVNLTQINTVGLSQVNAIGSGGQTNQVVGPQVNTFAGGVTTVITGSQSLAIDGSQTIGVSGSQSTSVSGATTITSSAEMKIQAASRKDISNGETSIMANSIKVVSNTNLALMAVGNIDATSIGSNTTVLGSNTSGYIGMNSEANMGMARSTFMGMSLNNSLGMDISNFGGLQIENAVALKLIGVGAAEIACRTLSSEQQGLKSFMPGAGAGAAAGAGVAGALGAAAGAAAAIIDVRATLKQYEDAQVALKEAAKEAAAEGLPGLAGRLSSLAKVAQRRVSDAPANAVPGATAIAEGLGIGAVGKQSDALANANPTSAGPSGTP